MVSISLLSGELLFAALWLLFRAAVWLKTKQIDWEREAWLLVMYINLAVILRFVFYSVSRLGGRVPPLLFDAALSWPPRLNLVPIVHILRFATRRDMLINLLGNVFLFLPSGIVYPLLYPRLRRFWRTLGAGALLSRLRRFWRTLGAGALLSLCLELCQLPFFERATDVDDLLLNTLGCAIGYGIWALWRAIADLRNRQKKGTQ